MSPHIEYFAAAASTILAAIAGSKTAVMLANAASVPLPDWMTWLLGPFGALIGVLLALLWMARRLNTAEAREEERRKEREADRKLTQDTLIALVRDTNSVATSATEIMRDVRSTIERCPGHEPPRHP